MARWSPLIAGFAVLLMAGALGGCASGRPDLASAVKPADIAYALCIQHQPGNEARCNGLELPSRAPETAYSLCLDYHPADARPCKAVREAYETDLRALLEAPARAANAPASDTGGTEIAERRYRQLHHSAEQLYIATSRDAQTFEAAVLIPDVRRKVEALLRQPIADAELRSLAQKSRAEAVYWYSYMQGLEEQAREPGDPSYSN